MLLLSVPPMWLFPYNNLSDLALKCVSEMKHLSAMFFALLNLKTWSKYE